VTDRQTDRYETELTQHSLHIMCYAFLLSFKKCLKSKLFTLILTHAVMRYQPLCQTRPTIHQFCQE